MSAPLDYEVVHCAPETDRDLELMNLTFNAKYDFSKYYIDPDLTAEIEAEKAKCAQLQREIHQWKTRDLSNPEVMRAVFVEYIYESLKQVAELAVDAHANHWSHQLVEELGGAQRLRENEAAEVTARKDQQGVFNALEEKITSMGSMAAIEAQRKDADELKDKITSMGGMAVIKSWHVAGAGREALRSELETEVESLGSMKLMGGFARIKEQLQESTTLRHRIRRAGGLQELETRTSSSELVSLKQAVKTLEAQVSAAGALQREIDKLGGIAEIEDQIKEFASPASSVDNMCSRNVSLGGLQRMEQMEKSYHHCLFILVKLGEIVAEHAVAKERANDVFEHAGVDLVDHFDSDVLDWLPDYIAELAINELNVCQLLESCKAAARASQKAKNTIWLEYKDMKYDRDL